MNLDLLLFRVLTRTACFCLTEDFWCGQHCHGQCLGGDEPEERKKKREDLIHSHRCVTLLLAQQEFTTEPMTKGRPPCSPLWPGEQYGDCEWLIPPNRWQVGPWSNQGTHFSTGLGCPSDRGGKKKRTCAAVACELSFCPEQKTGKSLWGGEKISSPLSVSPWTSL